MIYAGTGHRLEVLGGNTEEVHHKVVRYAKSILAPYKPTKIISGMAIGWDTALALAALDLGVPLIAAVPFVGQESIWPQHAQDRYNEILKQCAEVHIVCEGGYKPHKFHERDKWMVDHADEMIALWNGQEEGGTYATVKLTRKANKTLHNVWPGWEKFETGCPCGCGADSEPHCWKTSSWAEEGGR